MRALSMTIVATLTCICLATTVLAGEDLKEVTFEPVEEWANVFSGAEVKLHYTARHPDGLDGRLNWSLSVNRRTIEHGQLPLMLAAAHPAEATVAFKIPEVKEGVILEAQLSVAAYATGEQKPTAQHIKTIWIFPRDPFVDRTQWLKRLKITLFDPEGKTADVFDKARIPYTFTKNISALDDLGEGLLVIGEGTVWKNYRSLGETMVKAAARGVPVLCLAPGEGALVLPGTAGAELPPPASMTLRQEDIIRELDKRLDASAWPPKGQVTASRLTIKSDRDQVVAEASQAVNAWPWLEVGYPARKGRLLVCGFGIIRHWEATPAPRYLLSELFLRLTAEKLSTPLPLDERTK
ncbi:MAG: hypothetical protein WCJ35_11950 [Planctomycetota bacterium]